MPPTTGMKFVSPLQRGTRWTWRCPGTPAPAEPDHARTAQQIEIVLPDGTALRVKRELEGGWFQWISMPLPAAITIQSGINQLRYATLKGIMAAKKKEIKVVPAPSGAAAKQRIASIYLPQKSKQTRMISGSPSEAAKELVRVLREEARVF